MRKTGENNRQPKPSGTALQILGVDYFHLKTQDGGDLYLTEYGRPFLRHLLPDNWFEKEWFEKNRQRLEGSSTVYRVATRVVGNRSLDLVIKWCRVGEEVPFDTMTLNKFAQAEFNSPYEEFSLVTELRDIRSARMVRTHKPLGIYVPAERWQLWQTGRSESRIARKKARHRDVELDICRQYILIYEWIKGLSAVEALGETDIPRERQAALLADLTRDATADLAARGFRVLDMKPAHIIVRTDREHQLLRTRSGDVAFALVDFELLERTPEHAREVIQARRNAYLRRQRDRFVQRGPAPFPTHLQPADVFGVSYVFGHTESTQGLLWVVGKDPSLFDYFLPERWRRTRRLSLSRTGEVYYTRTKDNINLVWKVSRVGERPDIAPDHPLAGRALAHGYNSPFEEFSLALELGRRGINTVYPRAIYRTGLESQAPDYIEDTTRFDSHRAILTPHGDPILLPNHNYITLWGFWNGLDEMLANANPVYCEGINLNLAREAGYVSQAEHDEWLQAYRRRIQDAGMEDCNLKGEHVLLSLAPTGVLVRDSNGTPEMRHCNFEIFRTIATERSS